MKKIALILITSLCVLHNVSFVHAQSGAPSLLEKIVTYLDMGPDSTKKINFVHIGQKVEGFSMSPEDKITSLREKMESTAYPDKYIYDVFINVVEAIEAMVADYIYTLVNEPHREGKLINLPGTPEPKPSNETTRQKMRKFFLQEPDIGNFLKSIIHRKNLDGVSIFPLIDADEDNQWKYYTLGVRKLNKYLNCVTVLLFGLVKHQNPLKSFVINKETSGRNMLNYYNRLFVFYSELKSNLDYKELCKDKDLSRLLMFIKNINHLLSTLSTEENFKIAESKKAIQEAKHQLILMTKNTPNKRLVHSSMVYALAMIQHISGNREAVNEANQELIEFGRRLKEQGKLVMIEIKKHQAAAEEEEKQKTVAIRSKRDLESLEMTLMSLAQLAQ